MHSENEVVYLYLDDIIPNRFQPREVFDERALQELAVSIKEHGVIQPIIVRNIGEKYEIIAGERRYKASALAGLTKIPAIIRNLDDKESSKVALLENLQRRDLNSIEEARTYQKILELDQMTQEELARTMGKSQSAIANKLRLLTLPEEVQESLLKEKISERHARSLLSLSTPQEQIDMMNQVINNRMTVRELDSAIKAKQNPETQEYVQPTNSFNPMEPPRTPKFINFDQPMDTVTPIENNINQFISEPLPEDKPDFLVNKPVTTPSAQESKPIADLDFLLNLKEEPITESLSDQLDRSMREIPLSEPKLSPEAIVPNVQEAVANEPEIEQLFPIEDLNQELTPVKESNVSTYGLRDAINNVRDLLKTIEKNGFIVNSEEIDFENSYQIIIKIDKNK